MGDAVYVRRGIRAVERAAKKAALHQWVGRSIALDDIHIIRFDNGGWCQREMFTSGVFEWVPGPKKEEEPVDD